MKKQFIGLCIVTLVVTAVTITSFAPQQKDKNDKKEQTQDKGKNDDKSNQGKSDDKVNQGKNDDKGNQGKNDDKGNQGKKDDNTANDVDDKNKGKSNKEKAIEAGYDWDREKFKDRQKIRNQEKVTLCHKINRDGDPGVTISVSSNALKAHLDHGDVRGECPAFTDNRYSDVYINKRGYYYNVLQNGNEQVTYSQSILDYALSRLLESRSQLSQTSGLSQDEIQRRQATVVVLEQNVSLLETVLVSAARLLADKL
jgi:hypothetical protein